MKPLKIKWYKGIIIKSNKPLKQQLIEARQRLIEQEKKK